ncbi:MAG: methionine gamma-lyase family protein [Clostridia bacterium]|nr:methionine gamma-lyase family protein [Clostridia bacterium]
MEYTEQLLSLRDKAMKRAAVGFAEAERIAFITAERVLNAFQAERVRAGYLQGSTGYGYDDQGRDALDRVYARALEAEDALVRPHIISGTHALTIGLFAILRPGDIMLSVTGKPYDTLDNVIGIQPGGDGSLMDFGVKYDQVDFLSGGKIDFDGIAAKVRLGVRMVYIQKSKGYQDRPTLSAEQIGEICRLVKKIDPNVCVMVDNCYGEFTEEHEPTYYGVDLMAGSLIKNPGGGIAKIGGYLAGKAWAIEKCAQRTTMPGVGRESGATLNTLQDFYQGFFLAPHTVLQAKKVAIFASALFEEMGYRVDPLCDGFRGDIIQTVVCGRPEGLIAFCKGIQAGAPVDSYVTPEPWAMPGYTDPVIMAAGSFVGGASIELSADGPMRDPYIAFFQGGLTFETGIIGILRAAEEMLKL